MCRKIMSNGRGVDTSYIGSPFTIQHCPKCEKDYELLALGQDTRRNTVVCQFCAHPEFFVELDEEEQTTQDDEK